MNRNADYFRLISYWNHVPPSGSFHIGKYFGYNILSLILYDAKGRPLTSNKPVQAIVLMALLYLIYVSEAALGAGAWTFLMIVFLLLILRFGIYRHLAGYDEDQYFSRGAWAAAIAINIFGVAVLSLSLF